MRVCLGGFLFFVLDLGMSKCALLLPYHALGRLARYRILSWKLFSFRILKVFFIASQLPVLPLRNLKPS